MSNKTFTDIWVEGMEASELSAIYKAIETNTYLVVWRDEQIVKIPAKELKANLRERGISQYRSIESNK